MHLFCTCFQPLITIFIEGKKTFGTYPYKCLYLLYIYFSTSLCTEPYLITWSCTWTRKKSTSTAFPSAISTLAPLRFVNNDVLRHQKVVLGIEQLRWTKNVTRKYRIMIRLGRISTLVWVNKDRYVMLSWFDVINFSTRMLRRIHYVYSPLPDKLINIYLDTTHSLPIQDKRLQLSGQKLAYS